MDKLSKLIEELKAKIVDFQTQLKRAGEDRQRENTIFQTTIADQRATQKLLAGALNVLKGFYDQPALVQKTAGSQQPAGPPPPPGFKSYKNNAASGGVMGMIQGIIDDAKALEAEATRSEEEQQQAYESYVRTTNKSVEDKEKDIVNKSRQRAKAEQDKVEAEVNRDEIMATLEQLSAEGADLHRSCDFLLKNFDVRLAARDEELEALKQGIAMFSGASFSVLMQRWR